MVQMSQWHANRGVSNHPLIFPWLKESIIINQVPTTYQSWTTPTHFPCVNYHSSFDFPFPTPHSSLFPMGPHHEDPCPFSFGLDDFPIYTTCKQPPTPLPTNSFFLASFNTFPFTTIMADLEQYSSDDASVDSRGTHLKLLASLFRVSHSSLLPFYFVWSESSKMIFLQNFHTEYEI